MGQYSLRRSLMAFPPVGLSGIGRGCVAIGTEGSSDGLLQCLSEGDHDEPDWSNPATAGRKTVRARRNGAAERGVSGHGKSRGGWRERLSVLARPRCGGQCQRPLARKSRRPSVHAGQNGRKTSEPSEWKERARRILQDCTNPPG
jgi:hypothetical protein